MANSGYDEDSTRSLYIKYRVQKLKDEEHDQKELQNIHHKKEVAMEELQRKNTQSLAILQAGVSVLVYIFKWLVALMLIFGLIGLYVSYGMSTSGGDFEAFGVGGVFLLIIGVVVALKISTISKESKITRIVSRLNRLSCVLIPFTVITAFVSIGLFPVLGIILFILFVKMIIIIAKLNNALRFAQRNNLIN